jgi:hypothetical protein
LMTPRRSSDSVMDVLIFILKIYPMIGWLSSDYTPVLSAAVRQGIGDSLTPSSFSCHTVSLLKCGNQINSALSNPPRPPFQGGIINR